jgi:hypothetical protein
MPRDQRARDASGRRMQSTCQRRAPVISASFPDSGSRGPSSSPEDGARHTATARFGLCFAARASVVDPLRHAAKPRPLMSPSPLAVHRARGQSFVRSAEIAATATQCDWASASTTRKHLPPTEEPFSDPSSPFDSAFRRTTPHARCFARGGFCRRRLGSVRVFQPQPKGAF